MNEAAESMKAAAVNFFFINRILEEEKLQKKDCKKKEMFKEEEILFAPGKRLVILTLWRVYWACLPRRNAVVEVSFTRHWSVLNIKANPESGLALQ